MIGGMSIGVFWIDILCRPAFKALLKSPELAVMLVCLVYACIAYRCVKSCFDCQ
jgi:hypothetical protein